MLVLLGTFGSESESKLDTNHYFYIFLSFKLQTTIALHVFRIELLLKVYLGIFKILKLLQLPSIFRILSNFIYTNLQGDEKVLK